jgi:hypothetical protein
MGRKRTLVASAGDCADGRPTKKKAQLGNHRAGPSVRIATNTARPGEVRPRRFSTTPACGESHLRHGERLTARQMRRPRRSQSRRNQSKAATISVMSAMGGKQTLAIDSCLKLRVDSDRCHGHRSAVAVVGWVIDDLAVQGDVERFANAEVIIGFDDLLGARIRQPAVAN